MRWKVQRRDWRCNNAFPSFSLDLIQRWWIKHGDGCRPLLELGNSSGAWRPYAPESVYVCVFLPRQGVYAVMTHTLSLCFYPPRYRLEECWFRHLHLFLVESDYFSCFHCVPLYLTCLWSYLDHCTLTATKAKVLDIIRGVCNCTEKLVGFTSK